MSSQESPNRGGDVAADGFRMEVLDDDGRERLGAFQFGRLSIRVQLYMLVHYSHLLPTQFLIHNIQLAGRSSVIDRPSGLIVRCTPTHEPWQTQQKSLLGLDIYQSFLSTPLPSISEHP